MIYASSVLPVAKLQAITDQITRIMWWRFVNNRYLQRIGGADEELALIEGLESYGLGNWADVAGSLGREKTEVERHYLRTFIMVDSFPIPNMKRKFENTSETLSRKKAKAELQPAAMKMTPVKPLVSNPACHEIAGFLPGRLDFDVEYENDAELSIKDLQFEPDDGESEIELKLTILDIYNSRLTARSERKRILFEHNLVEHRKNSAVEKRRSRDEREVVNKAKPYARLMRRKDFEDFTEGLVEEVRLRREIKELQEWRKNGLTTMEQGARYERDKVQRATLLRLPLPPQISITPRARTILDPSELPGKPYKRNPNPLDISNAADVHLLTPAEQTLCSQLRILPKPYIAIKETLFRELMRNGGNLKRRQARELLRVDVNKTVYPYYPFFHTNE